MECGALFLRQTRTPLACDPSVCLSDIKAELGLLGLSVSADASAAVEMLERICAASPYLQSLLRKEAAWFSDASVAPERAFDQLLEMLRAVSLADLPVELRRAKRRVALLSAVCDLLGVWPLERVTSCLSRFADAAVDVSARALLAAEVRRGKLPNMTDADLDSACGYVVLAMGKMGAGELNYSSDIDLICLFDETRFDPEDYAQARASFIRVTRKMAAMLSEVTAEGYVFRTDLRLRPDASSTPVCLSMEAAERYYESLGRTWERAAYIKARPCAGDLAAGERFISSLRPFVWRKHLDFVAIQDAHDMRLRIRDHKKLYASAQQVYDTPSRLDGYHMKLGQGGIREIEFFTQTRQLIAGGRDANLRARTTQSGLQALAAASWLTQEVADQLYVNYRFYRDIEHRLQMIADQQTHELPSHAEGFARLSALMGTPEESLRADIAKRLLETHEIIEAFFAPSGEGIDTLGAEGGSGDEGSSFDAAWDERILERWQTYPALRSARAQQSFERLRPDILALLGRAAKPEEALVHFDLFLSGLPAGVQVFALFEANPSLTQLIVDICATAPALANYLSKNTAVFDAVIAGDFFADWPGLEALKLQFEAHLVQFDDYETRLNAARRWIKEWHFRTGVHYLRGLIGTRKARSHYTDLADVAMTVLWPDIRAEFARKHGPEPGVGAAVFGMGSLGAGLLHSQSDLDVIVVYDAAGESMSGGAKPLPVNVYYARLTQALVSALGAPMAEGRLYEIDMRLRPSGRQGPLATSKDAFFTYQTHDAWTWEYLALSRARFIVGAAGLGAEVMAFRRRLFAQDWDEQSLRYDVQSMRDKIAQSRGTLDVWDVKYGRGRLQDCELFVQGLSLLAGCIAQNPFEQLDAAVQAGVLPDLDAQEVKTMLALCLQLQTAARLLVGGRFDPQALGAGGIKLVLDVVNERSLDDLLQVIDVQSARVDALITQHLRREGI